MKTHLIKNVILTLKLTIIWIGILAQSAESVNRLTLTVSDLDRAVLFYTEVLGFEKTGEYQFKGEAIRHLFGLNEKKLTVQTAQLKIGSEEIELMEFSGTSPGNEIPADSRSNDLWFQHMAIVVSDMDKAYQHLWQHKVTHVSTAPQTLPDYIKAAAGIKAFYFRDPDGHNLELIWFPEGKGNPKWKETNGKLFLGIDHTAIGVDDTSTGLEFYEKDLKLLIGGTSENFGPEQEHLNQVFGARLLITGLHANQGFGIEFLDYIAPPGGRAFPPNSKPTDLWHWHVSIKTKGLDMLYQQFKTKGYHFVSNNGIATLENGIRAFMVRDPDGHAVLLYE